MEHFDHTIYLRQSLHRHGRKSVDCLLSDRRFAAIRAAAEKSTSPRAAIVAGWTKSAPLLRNQRKNQHYLHYRRNQKRHIH